MIRKAVVTFVMTLMGLSLSFAQNGVKSTADVILSGYSAKAFTSEPVSEDDITTILKCGIKAPSAMNRQPWKFTVIRDNSLAAGIIKNITPGNILIVVSGADPSKPGSTVEYDCGLATQNMYVAAQGLGLGAHIYMSGVGNINNRKQELGIADGYSAIAILRIGHIDNKVDAVSSASSRHTFDEVVSYR